MATRCPLCKAGALSLAPRELVYEGKVLATEAWLCSSCREILLDASQVESLRGAIRREGLGDTEEEIAEIVERVMIRSE